MWRLAAIPAGHKVNSVHSPHAGCQRRQRSLATTSLGGITALVTKESQRVGSSPASHRHARLKPNPSGTACQICASTLPCKTSSSKLYCRLQKEWHLPPARKNKNMLSAAVGSSMICREAEQDLWLPCRGATQRQSACSTLPLESAEGMSVTVRWLEAAQKLIGQWPSQLSMWCRGGASSLLHPD